MGDGLDLLLVWDPARRSGPMGTDSTGAFISSRLSGTRNVIFSYTNRNTDVVEKFFCRLDVTEKFSFLVTKLSPYYDR